MSDQAIDAVIIESLRARDSRGDDGPRSGGPRLSDPLAFRQRPGLPRVVASGPPLTTPGGHCHFLGGVVHGDPGAEVTEHAEHGVDVIKAMASGGFATPAPTSWALSSRSSNLPR
jgi:hypothetical protein